MDVAEGPIVDPGAPQLLRGTGGVGLVPRVAAAVGVQQADLEEPGRRRREQRGEVAALLSPLIADPGDGGDRAPGDADRHGLDPARPENRDQRRPRDGVGPPLERVVVAVDDE